ncbi:MAG: RbsD/FucU family protein [Angelakisella sp.]|nr:RbsD/FucU family protein [Angelakisella sp.]
MLKSGCIHPQIMQALSLCGHGDQILIADANYPLDSKSGTAQRVYLGLTNDLPTVTQVLKTLLEEIKVEKVEVMSPDNNNIPSIFQEFSEILDGMELNSLSRWDFYDACAKPSVRLAISTGEKRIFANILLTVGVA